MAYEVPTLNTSQTGTLLFGWLGAFWSQLCEDSELINRVMLGNGLLSAKLYQEFIDSLNLTNRLNIPAYHTDKWHTCIFLLSEKNQSKAALVKINNDNPIKIGPQTDSEFIYNSVQKIGENTVYQDVTAYNLPDINIKDIRVLVDNILNPKVILFSGIDYIIQDGAIFFLHDTDPFNGNYEQTQVQVDGIIDEQVILVGCDTLIDRKYLYNYAGYVLGFKEDTSEEYKLAINKVWDVYNKGPSLRAVRMAIASLLGEPFILEEEETIVRLIDKAEQRYIITDKNVYPVYEDAVIDSRLIPGYLLAKGDLLTETIKIFDKLAASTAKKDVQTNSYFYNEVAALVFPKTFFSANIKYNLSAQNMNTYITCEGTDKNGNDKFKFNLSGTEEDINEFWNYVWTYCENNIVVFADYLSNYLYTEYNKTPGSVCGYINPLEFFLNNFFGANSWSLVVDYDMLNTYGKANINKINLLTPVLPAHTFLFILIKRTLEEQEYDLDTNELEACDKYISKKLSDIGRLGLTSKRYLTYGFEKIIKRWNPACQK